MPDSLWPHELHLLWNSPGQNTGVDNHSLFPTQGSNPGLLHCKKILYHLSHQGSPTYIFSFSILCTSLISHVESSIKCMLVLNRSVVSNHCDPIDCSLPSSSVHGILQARILEWIAMPAYKGSSQLKDWTQVSGIAGRFFTLWAIREAHKMNTYFKGFKIIIIDF